MADKNLNLRATLDDKQANAAMKGLIQAFRTADTEHKKWLRSISGVNQALKDVSPAALQARDAMGRFTRETSMGLNNLVAKAINPVNNALRNMGSQFMGVLKWGGLLTGVSSGLLFRKATQDLISFSDRFSLMNATLRAQLPETKKFMQDSILSMSTAFGVKAEDLTDSLNQLFSSGFKPTAAEGTTAYKQQLEEVIKIQEQLTKAAVGTGSSMLEMQKAYVFTANAFGLDSTKFETVTKVTNALAGTLDEGIGWMSEYSEQFVKFASDAKQAGATMEESLGLFARFTKIMSPDRAGFTADAVFRNFAVSTKTATMAGNAMKQAIRDNLLSPEEQKLVENLGLTSEKGWLSQVLTGEKTADGQQVKTSFNKIMANMSHIIGNAKVGTVVYDALKRSMANNVNANRGLSDLLTEEGLGFTDWQKITESIENAQKTNLVQQKFDEMSKGFAMSWNRFTQSIRNKTLEATTAIAPAAKALLDVVAGAFGGKQYITAEGLAEAFATARAQAEKVHPALVPIVNMLEAITTNITNGNIPNALAKIGHAFGTMWNMASVAYNNVLKPIMQFFDKITGGNLILDLAILWGGANLMASIGTAYAGMLSTAIFTALTGGTAVAGAMTLGGVLWLGFAGAAVLGAAAIGIAIGTWLNKKRNEYDAEQAKAGVELSGLALDITDTLRGLQRGDVDPNIAAAKLREAENQKFSFKKGMLSPDDKNKLGDLGVGFFETLNDVSAQSLVAKHGPEKANQIAMTLAGADYGLGVTEEEQLKMQQQAQYLQSAMFAMKTVGSWYADANAMDASGVQRQGVPSPAVLGNEAMLDLAGYAKATDKQASQIKSSFDTLNNTLTVLNSTISSANRGSEGTGKRLLLTTP